MQKLWWPGYEMQLLGELQRQQNSAQFCDTLLQTEGISVPTHSCVLAALSPYLSEKLSASPAPPSGQKRRLQLQRVTAQTLLKVVGLLYSGELEVRGMKEQNEVLAAAHEFGIRDLILGCKDGDGKGGEHLNGSVGNPIKTGLHGEETRHRHRNLKMQDAQVQFGISGRNESDLLAKKKSFVSVSTQTVEASVTSAFSPDVFPGQTPPAPDCPSSVATFPQPLNTPLIEQFSDAEPTVGQSSGPNLTSSSTLSTPMSDEPSFLRSQEQNVSQQSSECGDGIVSPNSKRQRQEDENGNKKMTEDGGSAEQPGRVSGDEMVPEGVSKENRPSPVRTGGKNIKTMKQMSPTDTTQKTLKVKLRRRTEEEAWEVVNTQNKDEAVSVLTSVEQGCSHQKTPQTGLTDVQNPAPPNSPAQNPETPNLHPVTTASLKPPRHANTSSDSEPRSNDTLNQSSELDVEEPPQPQGPVEESEEAIDQMLEEIMMGLNILPNLYSNLKKAQMSHEGVPSLCQVPGTENGTESTAVHEAGCVFYQELETQDGHSSADAGIRCCIGAQNQPSCSGPSAVRPDLVTQQCSELNSSLRSSGRSKGIPSDRSETSLCRQSGSALSSACVSSEPTLHYPQPSSQRDHASLGVSTPPRENETRSDCTFPLPCMNDLRLPRCLSPLEHHSPKAQQHPNKSCKPENYVQPALRLQPWLTEAPCSQQTGNRTTSLPRDAKTCCLSEQSLHQVEWKPENWDACAESSTVEETKTKSTPEGKSDPKERRKRRCDATGDAATPKKRKRKRKNFPQEVEGQFLAPKKIKVCDGTKTVCSVSLSCNTSLMKERQVATNPSSILPEKPNEKSIITACVEKKSRAFGNHSAERTRIRTRGFVKKSQEKISDKVPEKRVLIPVVCRAVIEKEQGVMLPKRKRGRPRKIKLEQAPSNSVPDVPENMNQDPASEQQEVEEGRERKTRCRTRRRNESKAGTGHLKETGSSERSEKAEKDLDTKSKRSWMVTLKEFQKLIKQKHSTMRKSTENEETSKSMGEDQKRVDDEDEDDKMSITESLTIQDQAVCDAAAGENHNQSVSTSAALRNKPHQDVSTGDLGPEDNPASFDHVQKEEVVKLSSGSEQLIKNPDEEAFSLIGGPDAVQPSISDANLPQATKKAHNFYQQKTSPPLLGADGISMTSCDQEEEEEEEDVDILLFSPEKDPLTGVCEVGLSDVVLTPDEEEEEDDDGNEIDVTGDEAE